MYTISEAGRRILNFDFMQRHLAYYNRLWSHKAFNISLRLYLKAGAMPATNDIIRIMKQSNLYQVESDSTYERRSSSIKGWVNWIIALTNKL